MNRNSRRWILIAALVAIYLAVFWAYGALSFWSAVLDLGLVALAFGAVSVLIPLRLLGIPTRKAALGLALAGAAAIAFAILWPAPLEAHAGSAQLHRVMPACQFNEVHAVRIHASPARVREAMQKVTFAEVPVFTGLSVVRMFALGQFGLGFRALRLLVSGDLAKLTSPPILATLLRPGSPFIPLTALDADEVVFVLAGRFWENKPARGIANESDFAAYREPGSARAASNFRIEDLGGGWTRLTTETRVAGTDPAGQRTLTRYWRFIYPGSAMIRTMWLKAIRARAERAPA